MNKNPYLNAILAAVYIVFIVTIVTNFVDGPNESAAINAMLIPMTMISLFTLSAAVMAYLFVSEPIMMFLDGKKKEAISFFLTTTITFGVITLGFLGAVFYFL